MMLLILLAIISHGLAMPTSTSNATETLYKMMEKMKDRLFSAQCVTENLTQDPKKAMWTPPMECMWPKMHDMDHTVDEWATMMGKIGCTIPQERLLNMLKQSLAEENHEIDPIMNKFPKSECGMCGRRIQCCPANQFLVQSYRSIACESAPCQIEPMTEENWKDLRETYPKWNLPTVHEPCNFAAIMRESTKHSKVFPFMRTMYMQMVGSEIPTMNCEMIENTCACCCSGFVWRAGTCVPLEMETTQITTAMNDMTTTAMMIETTSMPMTETITEGTTTTMPATETKTDDTTVQTTTVRPIPQTTTPKILLNEDAEEEEKEKERHDEKKKRRSTFSGEEDDSEESLEAQVEELAETVAEEAEEENEEGAETVAEDIASSQGEIEADPVGEAIPA